MEKDSLEQLKSRIRELHDQLNQLPSTREKKILQEILESTRAFARANENIKVLLKVCKRGLSNKREYSLLEMSLFLWAFEGLYGTRLDIVCLLLTASGHDLFNLIKREYASTLEEISEVDMSTKFKFLERHKMKILIRKQDQRLRNRIAHHDFKVDEKGVVSVDGEEVNVYSRLTELQTFVMKFTDILVSAAKESWRA